VKVFTKTPTPRSWIAALLAAALLFGPSTASAQRHPTLTKAKQEYVNQNHAKVIELVKPLVEPRSILATEAEEAEAYELLGLSYWWTKKYKASEAAFLVLLSMRPKHRLKKAVHAAGVVKFFNKVKKKFRRKPSELKKRQKEELDRCKKALVKTKAGLKRLRKRCRFRVIRKKEYKRRWMMFIPFGVGQFVNGDKTRGWIYFSIQTALALLNITAQIMGATKWAWRRNSEGYLVPDVKKAQMLQIIQISSGSVFLAAVTVGIIDALVNYQPAKTREIRIPVESKTAGTGRLKIWPSFGPKAGMLNFSMDF
jgi:hypothetical protein